MKKLVLILYTVFLSQPLCTTIEYRYEDELKLANLMKRAFSLPHTATAELQELEDEARQINGFGNLYTGIHISDEYIKQLEILYDKLQIGLTRGGVCQKMIWYYINKNDTEKEMLWVQKFSNSNGYAPFLYEMAESYKHGAIVSYMGQQVIFQPDEEKAQMLLLAACAQNYGYAIRARDHDEWDFPERY